MHHRQTRGRLAALGIAVVVAATVVACGGSSSPSSTTTSTSSADAAVKQPAARSAGSTRTALVACLAENGVKLPAGAFPGWRVGATGGAGRFGFGRGPFGVTGRRGPARAGRGFFGGATGARGAFGALANPKLLKALQKCRGLIAPPGGFRRFGATGATGASGFLSTPAVHAQVTRFVACMRKNGVKLPPPNLSGTGTIFAGVNQTSTAFRSAYSTCRSLISFLRGGAPSTG